MTIAAVQRSERRSLPGDGLQYFAAERAAATSARIASTVEQSTAPHRLFLPNHSEAE
ncbi:MAG: hypothetical protein OXC54_09040 [Rhodospirillaceae bacterium]|nr:hypothetical protein [Rhodospirillaceae bacterium]